MAFYCPDCRHKIEVRDAKADKVTCPACKRQFPIPDEHRKGVLKPGIQIGGYEITRLIGIGGMGQVYEAKQLSLDRRVALKIFSHAVAGSGQVMKQFLLEVRNAAALSHPNIITVYEAAQKDDTAFLAMAYIDGQSVDQILEDSKQPIPEKDALLYAEKIAEAMTYAWSHQRLVHRDIKPANIIIDQQGEVNLCDLGVAKRPDDEYDISKAGFAIGTPHYMSPEQGQGLVDIDFRADMYSLGATLFNMATGTLPFDSKVAQTVITKHMLEPLPPPRERNPDLSDPCCKLIELLMAKKPEERHPDWEVLIADIKRVREGKYPVHRPSPEPAEAETASAESPATPKSTASPATPTTALPADPDSSGRQNKLVWIAALLLVLALILAIAIYYVRHRPMAEGSGPGDNSQSLSPDDGTPPHPVKVTDSPREVDPEEAAAAACLQLAAQLEAAKKYAEAEKALRTGVGKYLAKYPGLADPLAVRLLLFFKEHQAKDKLSTFSRYVCDEFPNNGAARALAAELRVAAAGKAATTAKKAVPAHATRRAPGADKLLADLKTAKGDLAKAKTLFKLAELYRREGMADQRLECLEEAAREYGGAGKSWVGGKALSETAEYYKRQGRTVRWEAALTTLLVRKYCGENGEFGLPAAWALANYYGGKRNLLRRNEYLRLIVSEFPGLKGQNAGQAALLLVREDVKSKRFYSAVRRLRKIGAKYPGVDGVHRRAANAELERLTGEYPRKMAEVLGRDTGPFAHVIYFNALEDSFIHVHERTRSLSKARAITAECWFRQEDQSRLRQYLLSRHGDNFHGFNLCVQDDKIIFQFSDGKRTHVLSSPSLDTGKWHHVAAVVGGKNAALYVDGKRVAASTQAVKIANQGGGRLRVGRCAWRYSGYFSGAMQHIMVFPKVIYTQNFKPEPKVHDLKRAAICITASNKGPKDLRRNKLELHLK